MPQRLRIAALQSDLRWHQPMHNMFALRQAVEKLPLATDVVVLPEMWSGVAQGPQIEQLQGQCRQFLQTLARKCNVHVVGGSYQTTSGGALQNVTVVVDHHGEIAGSYAKRTLFGAEQDTHRAGSETGLFELYGWTIAVLICADLWDPARARELLGRADALCVPTKTSVPSDQHVVYARTLWHSLALTRAMENGLPVIVSDWAAGRHSPKDVDVSVGSAHAGGTDYDPGILQPGRRPRRAQQPTATAHSSATPALGSGVHFTCGATTICNPGQRPDLAKIHRTLPQGEPGFIYEEIDMDAVRRYRDYRRGVGLLPETPG